MRQNGNGTITLEDARTWLEETGLCLFLPRRQFSAPLAPSFVEAVAGQHNPNPDQHQIAVAEDLLVRLETDGVAVRLNLLGQPGEQPDYVVAAWVLPYVYALRGDRDWRRIPQLTGSRQVSPLAIQAYKRLESGDQTIAELKHALGHGVSDSAVLRAITELWQQLRIIPVISAPGKAARWQLLRIRFQKAIAEGASTSQVTAISVLASIFLQAVIAAGMEEVELFLSPLTARSKIREVLRGLLATRQVHTLSLGHAPHFYVAGTLPEFTVAPTVYASSIGSAYLSHLRDQEDFAPEPAAVEEAPVANLPGGNGASGNGASGNGASGNGASGNGAHRPASQPKNVSRGRFSRNAGRSRDRKPASASPRRSSGPRPESLSTSRTASSSRWGSSSSKNGNRSHAAAKNGHAKTGSAKPASSSWSKRGAKHAGSAKPGRSASLKRGTATARKESRPSTAARSPKRPGLAARGPKKRG
jgi:hypothetical protein